MKESFFAYWNARSARERRVLAAGAVALALMLGYALLWRPARQGVTQLQNTLPQLRTDLNAMRAQGEEFARLRQAAPKSRLDAAGMRAAVQAAATKRGIERAIERTDMTGADRMRIVLGSVSFESWIGWVDSLQRDHQIVIEAARIDTLGRPGFAKVEMVLYLPNAP